jgi:hypothetical protein
VKQRHTHEAPNTNLQRDVHTLYCARIYFRLTRFQQYHMNIILPDNSHHSSLGPFRVTAGRVALAAIPHCRESGLRTSVHQTAVNIRLLLAVLCEVVERLCTVSHTCITSNELVIQCMSDWNDCRSLSNKTIFCFSFHIKALQHIVRNSNSH